MRCYLNIPDCSGSSPDWRHELVAVRHRKLQSQDINRAEPWLLEALPGIGEVLAQGIADYRSENGPFRRIEDLLKVSGIGPATFEQIKDFTNVSA